jgi:hypothetical protein
MSPLAHVAPDAGIPPIVMLVQGSPVRVGHVRRFTNALVACGIDAEMVHLPRHSHRSINASIGKAGDPVTDAVVGFLAELGHPVLEPAAH